MLKFLILQLLLNLFYGTALHLMKLIWDDIEVSHYDAG
jgi:hypothetical protein